MDIDFYTNNRKTKEIIEDIRRYVEANQRGYDLTRSQQLLLDSANQMEYLLEILEECRSMIDDEFIISH